MYEICIPWFKKAWRILSFSVFGFIILIFGDMGACQLWHETIPNSQKGLHCFSSDGKTPPFPSRCKDTANMNTRAIQMLRKNSPPVSHDRYWQSQHFYSPADNCPANVLCEFETLPSALSKSGLTNHGSAPGPVKQYNVCIQGWPRKRVCEIVQPEEAHRGRQEHSHDHQARHEVQQCHTGYESRSGDFRELSPSFE